LSARRDPVEQYLDRLLVELRGRVPDVHRILVEVDDHLREAIAEGMSAQDAIAAFGSPRAVARRFDSAEGAIIPDVFRMVWKLAAVGLIAIGLSGVLSIGMRAAWGSAFVAGDPTGVTYTPARCADYREYHPSAATCAAAASAHHADEVEQYRVLAGVLGVAAFGFWRWKFRSAPNHLPIELDATVAAVAFGLGGLACLAEGVSMLAEGTQHGAGQWLSAAVVALGAAAYAATRVARTLRVAAS